MQHGFNRVMPSQRNGNQIDQKSHLNENMVSLLLFVVVDDVLKPIGLSPEGGKKTSGWEKSYSAG